MHWSESLRTEPSASEIREPPSFLELQEETATEAAVGEVHSSSSSEEVGEVQAQKAQKVGEVHLDRSHELLREWQEEGVDVYSASQGAPSVSTLASEATEALQSFRPHPSKDLASFPILWIALLILTFVATVVVLLYLGLWKIPLEEQVPQWLPEALSQDLVSREVAPKLVEEGLQEPEPKVEPKQPQKPQKPQESQVQEQLTELVRQAVACTEANLEQILPSAAGYDCALSKPVSSGQPLKLLCRIEGALPGGPPPLGLLRAPLSQRSCVCFRAVAEGSAPKKAAEAVDFQVSLVGAPWIRIDVQGHEVKLLNAEGAYTPYQVFGDLPKHWKNFVSPERDSKFLFGLPSPQPPAPEGQFRFREDVLQVGSEVVLCGELIRDSSGRVFLQPWQAQSDGADAFLRTSWELDGCPDLERPHVLATTDATLMEPAQTQETLRAESCFDDFSMMVP